MIFHRVIKTTQWKKTKQNKEHQAIQPKMLRKQNINIKKNKSGTNPYNISKY